MVTVQAEILTKKRHPLGTVHPPPDHGLDGNRAVSPVPSVPPPAPPSPRRPSSGMDIARPDLARKRKMRQGAYAVLATVVILLVTFGVQRLQPAAPRVDRNTVYIDTVRRGPMVRQVRGTGTLVPEEIRWIPATTKGNVERIVIDPGAEVTPESVIVELSNPELEQQAQEAELNLRTAETRYENRRVELESDLLILRATLASVEAALTMARLEADANAELAKDGLVSRLQLQLTQATEREQETRFALEQERLRLSETRVRLGRASVNTIEVLEGFEPGDQVVLSDMSAWDEFDRVRLD